MADFISGKAKYSFLIRFAVKTCAAACIAAAVFIWVVAVCRMDGNAMFPSVRDGDLCVFYRLDACYVNDVVLYEDGAGELMIGRIAAVGGQTIDFPDAGGYEVNGYQSAGEIPYETYAAEESAVVYPLTLDEDSYFILNDFRSDVSDSRWSGPVSKAQIKGRLLFLLRRRGF